MCVCAWGVTLCAYVLVRKGAVRALRTLMYSEHVRFWEGGEYINGCPCVVEGYLH